MNRLKDKVILITGSTSGIGEGMARTFAREGARVMIHGKEQADAQRMAADIGGEAASVFGSLEDPEVPGRLIAETVAHFGRLDGLVNNAATITRSSLETTDSRLFDYVIAVNLKAPFLLIQAALPHFRRQHSGAVLNIGSMNAYTGERNQFIYSVSKGALMTLTRNLADGYITEGMRVNQFNIGWTLTANEYALKRSEGLGEDWPSKVGKAFAPSGRLLSPLDIAWAAVYFLSDESQLVNGAVLDLEQYPLIGRNPVKESTDAIA
jgi:NAD(P)-dependent dehydrogenase (short-subunit alcohol dehydrogenase family)